jgi:GWxTD domain-containing protein
MNRSENRINHSCSLLVAIALCTLFRCVSIAQADVISGPKMPLKSNGDLLFYSDIYQFETMADKIRMEVCYSLDLAQLYIDSQPRNEYAFSLSLNLFDSNGTPLVSISDSKKIDAQNFQSGEQASFIDLIKFDIQPDTLNFVLTLSDSVSGKSGIIKMPITVRPVSEKLSCSDPIFIAYLNKTAGKQSVFTRHNLEMIPNPARFYEIPRDNNFMYIYFEINNLAFNPEKPSLYSMVCSVENLAGESITSIEHAQLAKIGANTSRIEKINLEKFITGIYSLNLHIADLANDNSSSVQRYFQVMSSKSDSSLIIPMEEADVERYYDQIKYIASKQELDLYRQLDPAGKQEFLLYFWKNRDPSPDTPENEYMINHFMKIEYCEKNFRNGINSDRGRVYIQYGPPVDIERSASTLRYSKPVEIWTYSLEGRIEFFFVDRTNDDNYVLVHSTHPDEYSNPDWMKDFQVYR